MTKVKFLLPLLLIIAAAAWWFIPHYSDEDKAYYVAVFCAIDHQDEQQFIQQMQNVIEGGNSDYALQKIRFKPGLGRKVVGDWQQLTPDEQQRAAQDNLACQQLLTR
ncbi:hypothetical protein [Pantoea sp. C2G6]|uniref:hypothetical protein n=1 Tax=Pantoea sp. C2G6 TaxID=3243084 RepID=UPI003ED96E8C